MIVMNDKSKRVAIMTKKSASKGAGKVDRQTTPITSANETGIAVRDSAGRFLPGNKLSPGRGKTLIALTEELRVASITENSERIFEIGREWLESNDPFKQKLYFEYFFGKPKQQVALPAAGQNNIDVMRFAMTEEARAKQAEAELAKFKAELEGRTIDIAKGH